MRSLPRPARLASAVGLLLAGTAVAVTTGATPAAATVVNSSTAVGLGTPSASAVATCPMGEFLAGAGGSTETGAGNVTLTDIIPNLATRSVTVWGHANPGAVPGAYTVVAQAICLPGPPPPGYQLVLSSSGNNGDPIKNQVAACPAGTDLLGLGARLQNANGEAFYQRIAPNAALTAGVATAGAAGGFAGPWQLTAYAICAAMPAGLTGGVFTATGPLDSGSPKLQLAPGCPAGAVASGVGAALAPSGTGNVLLTRVMANAPQDNAGAVAFEDGLYLPTWDLTSHLICWG